MAEKNNLRYLDEHGLQVLADEGFLAPHPGKPGASVEEAPAAKKIGRDAYGHVTFGEALKYADLEDKPTIGDGKFVLQVNGTALTPTGGDFTANKTTQSTYNITAESLGLSQAMKFIGITTSNITDDSTTNPVIISSKSVTATAGNVVLFGDDEFVWTGSKWEELGGIHGTESAGSHNHTTSTTIPANTYVNAVTPSTTKLALDAKTASAVTEVTGSTQKLVTTSIKGVSGTTTASAVSETSTTNIAKLSGTTVTVAKKADTATPVGNAKINGTITYGNADMADADSTFMTGATATASKPTVTVQLTSTIVDNGTTKERSAYYAEVKDDAETLVFMPVSFNATATATAPTVSIDATTDTIRGVVAAKSTTPAVTTTDTQIYAVDGVEKIATVEADTIQTYTFRDVTVATADANATTVATGALHDSGTGASVMTGISSDTATVLLNTTKLKANDTIGDVSIVSGVTTTKNKDATFSGAASDAGEHTHVVV